MTGRPDYDAGDLVVCVDDGKPNPACPYPRKLGAVLVVAHLLLENPPLGKPHFRSKEMVGTRWSHPCDKFRRINPKPPEFWTGDVDVGAREGVPA